MIESPQFSVRRVKVKPETPDVTSFTEASRKIKEAFPDSEDFVALRTGKSTKALGVSYATLYRAAIFGIFVLGTIDRDKVIVTKERLIWRLQASDLHSLASILYIKQDASSKPTTAIHKTFDLLPQIKKNPDETITVANVAETLSIKPRTLISAVFQEKISFGTPYRNKVVKDGTPETLLKRDWVTDEIKESAPDLAELEKKLTPLLRDKKSLIKLARESGLDVGRGRPETIITLVNILQEEGLPVMAYVRPGTEKYPPDRFFYVYPKKQENRIRDYVQDNLEGLKNKLDQREDTELINLVKLEDRPRYFSFRQLMCMAGFSIKETRGVRRLEKIIKGIENKYGVRFVRFDKDISTQHLLREDQIDVVINFLKNLRSDKAD